MSILMTFIVALKALRRNAMRTALTALGMIIGVAAVIVMVAIGTGAKSAIQSQIRSAGSNIVMVTAGSGGFGPVRQGQGAVTTLTADDAEAIRREIPGVRYISPGLNSRQQDVATSGNWNTQVQGTDAYWGMKQAGRAGTRPQPRYEPIEMPRNTPVGVIIAFFSVIAGFALIWHIWWLAIIGLIGLALAALSHAWSMEREMVIPADEVAAFERARAPGGGT